MRHALLVSVVLAATLLFTAGAIGQQEALLVDLSVEPERLQRSMSLFDAATANDFITFDAVYRATPQAEYAELHRLWRWSMEDPIGAFYGADTYERLAAMYPGFSGYIAEYRIVDSNGNVFYPTVETRRFLLREAVYGYAPRPREVIRVAKVEAPKATAVVERPVAPAVARVRTPAPQSAPVTQSAPVPQSAPVTQSTPVTQVASEAVSAPAVVQTEAPQRTAALQTPRESLVRRNEAARGALSRSIFLMIAGLIGIGILTVMLQTPREDRVKP